MDFRPSPRTLYINYALLVSVLAAALVVGKYYPARIYYWPEYTSHTGYVLPAQTCSQCHSQPYQPFEERTCYTGGCHSGFDPVNEPLSEAALAALEAKVLRGELEAGVQPNRPGALHFASIVQFHRLVRGSAPCLQCHPAHKLPQTGRFNEFTIRAELEKRLSELTAPTPKEIGRIRSQIFHQEAGSIVGAVACRTCHPGFPDDPQKQPPPDAPTVHAAIATRWIALDWRR
jgi:hypothetical protein